MQGIQGEWRTWGVRRQEQEILSPQLAAEPHFRRTRQTFAAAGVPPHIAAEVSFRRTLRRIADVSPQLAAEFAFRRTPVGKPPFRRPVAQNGGFAASSPSSQRNTPAASGVLLMPSPAQIKPAEPRVCDRRAARETLGRVPVVFQAPPQSYSSQPLRRSQVSSALACSLFVILPSIGSYSIAPSVCVATLASNRNSV